MRHGEVFMNKFDEGKLKILKQNVQVFIHGS